MTVNYNVLFSFFFLAFATCNLPFLTPSQTIKTNGVTIMTHSVPNESQHDKLKKKADHQDINIVSQYLLYPNARLIWTATYSSHVFFENEEAILILESPASLQKIINYYKKNVQKRGWKIIQYRKKENVTFFTIESPTQQRLLTIVLRKKKESRQIKLYLRPIPL